MQASDYQKQAARTLIDNPDMPTPLEYMLLWNGLGIAGEAGEICDLLKKGICHDHGLDCAKVAEELGDLMWYVAALCTKLNMPLDAILENNITKLYNRYPDGYSSAASKARVDQELVKPYQEKRYFQPFSTDDDAVKRASVRSPLPGDMAVCLHCQEQIRFSQMGFWIHLDPTDPKIAEHNPEPHPF